MSQAPFPRVQTNHGRYYVYVHCREDDGGPFYVGKGSGRRAWVPQGRSAWWNRIVAKHGLVVKIHRHFQDESEAFASEIETIAILRDLGYQLCNLTIGGEGMSGFKFSEEANLAKSKRTTIQMSSPEARMRISQLKCGEANTQSKLSDEKVRQIHLGANAGDTGEFLSKKFSVSRGLISMILSGKRRRNIYLEFHPEAQTEVKLQA